MGCAVRASADGGRTGPGLARPVRQLQHVAAAAASLGQVHRAIAPTARPGVKLQYPDMASAVEADLAPTADPARPVHRMDPAIDTREIGRRSATGSRGTRLRARGEAWRSMAILRGRAEVRVPESGRSCRPTAAELGWLDGRGLLDLHGSAARDPQPHRGGDVQGVVAALRPCRGHSRRPAPRELHRFSAPDGAAQLNLLDFGCIRIFPPRFVAGVVRLYHALRETTEPGTSTPIGAGVSPL